MNRRRISILGLVALAALAAAVVLGTSASAATQQLGPFTVTDSVTTDATAGTTTVTYTVTPANPANQFDVTIESCNLARVVSISHNGKIWPDKDPSTKVAGPLIRFPANSNNKPGNTLVYSYTVQGIFDPSTEPIAIKSKNNVYTGTAGGIGCSHTTSTPPTQPGTPGSPSTPASPGTPSSHPNVVPGPSPTSCVDRRKFTFSLHKFRKARIVEVDVFVNNVHKVDKHGRNLHSVTIKKLPLGTFTVRIVSRQNTGSSITSIRKYNQCRKGHPKVHSHHARPHH
jgi:hypothetical protein